MQREWVQKGWAKQLERLIEDRDDLALKVALDGHEADLTRQLKTADGAGGKPLAEHLTKEIASFAGFRKDRGL